MGPGSPHPVQTGKDGGVARLNQVDPGLKIPGRTEAL